MKKIIEDGPGLFIVALVVLFTTFLFADHDEVKVITPVAYEGWNLLGFSLQPHVVNDSIVSSGYDAIMYAALNSRVFYYDQTGYTVADSFIMGEGFWMKSFVEAPLIQEGIRSSKRIHILYEGWNIITPLEKEINPLLLVASHPTIDSIWGWDTFQYHYKDILADQSPLVPGVGYWVHAIHEDTLFYDGFSNQIPPQPPAKMVAPRSQENPPPLPIYIGRQTWGDVKKHLIK